MADLTCHNCRYYLPEDDGAGDCLSMMSGRVKTKEADLCGAYAAGRPTDLALELPVNLDEGA